MNRVVIVKKKLKNKNKRKIKINYKTKIQINKIKIIKILQKPHKIITKVFLIKLKLKNISLIHPNLDNKLIKI